MINYKEKALEFYYKKFKKYSDTSCKYFCENSVSIEAVHRSFHELVAAEELLEDFNINYLEAMEYVREQQR